MKTDNELIALFDGWIKRPEYNKGTRIQWVHQKYSARLSDTLQIPCTPENMKYSTSWSWLMPVVEKIGAHDYMVQLQVDPGMKDNAACIIIRRTHIISIKGSSLIEVTYSAVVEFIKWYNEQKGHSLVV